MFGFKKKTPPACADCRYWEVYPQFRWHRIASGYDATKEQYILLTEPILQYKASKTCEWRNISTDTDVMKPIASATIA